MKVWCGICGNPAVFGWFPKSDVENADGAYFRCKQHLECDVAYVPDLAWAMLQAAKPIALEIKTEIERRYLVDVSTWRRPSLAENILQGYLSLDPARLVRVRLTAECGANFDTGYLTIKGEKVGATCPEYEYRIPVSDGKTLLSMCLLSLVTKTRYTDYFNGKTWYVDVFHGDNQGLVLAEIELADEGEQYDLPPWLGREITNESRYSNASLARAPYSKWKDV